MDGPDGRERAMRALCEREHPPGVVTYLDGVAVGWCNIGPRAEITRLVHSKLILPTDDLPVWSIVCLVVRGGHRRKGVVGHLLEGAVAYAAANGAPAVEATRSTPKVGWTPRWRSSAPARCSRRPGSWWSARRMPWRAGCRASSCPHLPRPPSLRSSGGWESARSRAQGSSTVTSTLPSFWPVST